MVDRYGKLELVGALSVHQATGDSKSASCSRRQRPSDGPLDISPNDKARLDLAKQQAENLGELSGAVYLRTIAKSFGDTFSPAAFQAFRDRFLREAGDPTDPVEQLMLEQLFLAHHHIGRLHQRAADAVTPEAAKVYFNSLARLQGEARRLGLAIRLYRSPVHPKQFTVVRQQNIAAGDQQVALVDGTSLKTSKVSNSSDAIELTSNNSATEGTPNVERFISTESAACRCRPEKPRKTRAAVSSRR